MRCGKGVFTGRQNRICRLRLRNLGFRRRHRCEWWITIDEAGPRTSSACEARMSMFGDPITHGFEAVSLCCWLTSQCVVDWCRGRGLEVRSQQCQLAKPFFDVFVRSGNKRAAMIGTTSQSDFLMKMISPPDEHRCNIVFSLGNQENAFPGIL